jgi:hypothetical protein
VNNNTIESSSIGVGVFAGASGATFSIQDNQFQTFANDEVFVDDSSATVLNLTAVRDNNTFDPSAVVANNQIVPETSVNVVNVGQRTGFDNSQPAVDGANPPDTIELNPSTYSENVMITTDDLTLSGAGPGQSAIKGQVFVSSESEGLPVGSVSGLTMSGFTVNYSVIGDQSLDIQTGGTGAAPSRTWCSRTTSSSRRTVDWLSSTVITPTPSSTQQHVRCRHGRRGTGDSPRRR